MLKEGRKEGRIECSSLLLDTLFGVVFATGWEARAIHTD